MEGSLYVTNPEDDQPGIPNAIVACGSCDNVFRVHEGRPTCPACGGDPNLIILDLDELTPAEAVAPVSDPSPSQTAEEVAVARPASAPGEPPDVGTPQDSEESPGGSPEHPVEEPSEEEQPAPAAAE